MAIMPGLTPHTLAQPAQQVQPRNVMPHRTHTGADERWGRVRVTGAVPVWDPLSLVQVKANAYLAR
jgi:hypothetical protein